MRQLLLVLMLLILLVSLTVDGKRGQKRPNSKAKPKTKPEKSQYAKFAKYTLKNTGGRCWWDIRRTDCAKCKPGTNAMACGYPMHKYCYKKSDRLGCPGVPNNKYTFSARGHPCFWDHTDYRCAWCSAGGYQCGPGQKTGPESPKGNRCARGKDKHYCDSVLGDCRHIPACDANAECRYDRPFGTLNIFKCVCNKGFTGNGIQCMGPDGVIGKNPDKIVTVQMDLETDFFKRNNKAFVFPFGAQNKVFKEMKAVENKCQKEDCMVNYKQVMKNMF